MTHKELVKLAMQIVKRKQDGLGAKIAYAELVTECSSRETPDVMGFASGLTVLIECKVTHADFIRDANKVARRDSGRGMGHYRWYLCPWGIIAPNEIPERWGLIWHVDGTRCEVIRKAEHQNSNHGSERDFLYSVVRRLQK